MMTQPLLQPEILEVVFSNLDGKSLLESSRVCSTWRNVVEYMSGVTKVWKQCCEEEIHQDVLTDISTNLYPRLWTSSQEDNTKWRNIYLCWVQWRNIGHWPSSMKEVFSISGRNEFITCMKMSGNCIITGHLYGGIHIWDCSQGYLGFVTMHLKEVTDLGLLYIPGLKFSTERELDVKHNLIISTSLDHTVKVTSLCLNAEQVIILRQHVGPTTSIGVYRSMFVVTGEDNCLSIWNIVPHTIANKMECPVLVYSRQDIDNPVQVVSLWKGKVTGITASNHFFCLKRLQGESINAEINGLQKFEEKNSHIVRKYIWRHWICAWLTGHHQMYIAVGENHASRKYNTMPALLSYPTALLLYGELFLLGMESGIIYLYLINSPEDLLKLDLDCYQWKYSVSPEPILFLDIAEDTAEPMIVVTAGQKLYYISLQLS